MQLSPSQVDAIREWATSGPEIAEVRLYGSRATGEAHPGRDVDLAVTVTTTNGPDQYIGEYRQWAAQLSLKIWQRAHVERYADNVYGYCQECSVVLFTREP